MTNGKIRYRETMGLVCLCSIDRWNPNCPRHGTESKYFKTWEKEVTDEVSS